MSTLCQVCDQGKYSQASHASAPFACLDCNTGSFCAYGCSICLNCSVGSYQSSTGGYTCSACSKGTYSNETGASSVDACKLCHAGSYSNLNSSTCSQCQSGTYSTALGYAGPCSSWKSCQLFVEVENDFRPPSSVADRECIAYQHDPPRAAKILILFGQFPFCCLICFIFIRYAPRCCFVRNQPSSSDQSDACAGSENPMDTSDTSDNYGCVLFDANVQNAGSFLSLVQMVSCSRLIAPVHKSLIGAFHDFVLGVHDVVSDASLILLVSRDAPGFLFKNIRGDLFYMATFGVFGSIIVDCFIAWWCGEMHLLWLYIASCTDIVPSRRGHFTSVNKVLKFLVESIPVSIVQSVFIYQTYMKYQADWKSSNLLDLNTTYHNQSTFSAANTQQVQNSDWWIDYGIVFQSMLTTIFNMLKNFFSIWRMLQFKWNHVAKLDEITSYVELIQFDNSEENPILVTTCKVKRQSKWCDFSESISRWWDILVKSIEKFLRVILFINSSSIVQKEFVHHSGRQQQTQICAIRLSFDVFEHQIFE